MFDGDNLFGSATTLTESSLNIGISAEDVRGGEGAGLLGRYFHTSTFELTLTDALFNMEYLAKSVGAEIQTGADVMANEEITSVGTTITLSKTARPLGCGEIMAWFKLPADEKWTAATVNTGNTITVPKAGTYCVKYFYNNSSATKLRIASDYVPATLRLVLKENLYAAGETNDSQTKVGYVLINIPRFQLDGSQELSMSMTGASTTSLKGMALISDGCSAGCEGAGYYADMVQVLNNVVWYDGITGLAVDGGSVKLGDKANVYAIFANKTPKLISDDMLKIIEKDTKGNDIEVELELVIPEVVGNGDVILRKKNAETSIASGKIIVEAAPTPAE